MLVDAVDQRTSQPVTIKVIRPSVAASPAFRREFSRRIAVARSLSHPNIATVVGAGEMELNGQPTLFWAVDYLGGGSLRDLFDRGRYLQPSQVLVVGLEACRALDAAHQRGIVHTEITPSKLVFGEDRRLRIVDFGIASLLGEASWADPPTVPTHVARYASPEQALGMQVDAKTDVYALSLCLIEAVTGSVPFAADSTVSTLAARVGKLMPVSADLGPLASVLERAGRPEAADRFTAAEFARALAGAASKLPRPEPVPVLLSTAFAASQMRRPTDPTGPLQRPPGDDDELADEELADDELADEPAGELDGAATEAPAVPVADDDASDATTADGGVGDEPGDDGREAIGAVAGDAGESVAAEPDDVAADAGAGAASAGDAGDDAGGSVATESDDVAGDAGDDEAEHDPAAAAARAAAAGVAAAGVAATAAGHGAGAEVPAARPGATEAPTSADGDGGAPSTAPGDASAADAPDATGPRGAEGVETSAAASSTAEVADERGADVDDSDAVEPDEVEADGAPEPLIVMTDLADPPSGAVQVAGSTPAAETAAAPPGARGPTTDVMPAALAPDVTTEMGATDASAVAQPYDEERPTRRLAPIILIALVVLIGLGGVVYAGYLLLRTKSYEVPDLVGVEEAVARNEVAGNGWDIVTERERSDEQPEIGDIIRTDPAAGVMLDEGETILFVVSDGPELRTLPDFTGEPVQDAVDEIYDLALESDVLEPQYSEDVPPGDVISWSVQDNPALVAGAQVLPGTVIELVPSQGPAPREVPDLAGLDVAQATAQLDEIQLATVQGEDVFSDDVAVGIIVQQNPTAGSMVERGSEVTVQVSKGPDVVSLPDLDGMTCVEADAALVGAGFVVGDVLGTTQGAFVSLSIDGQSADPGEVFRRGTAVDLICL